MHAGWLVAAVAAELASMVAFARLNRFALRASGVPVRLRDATATVFAGNALSVTLPGGALASLAYTARRLRALGASASLTAFSLAATGVLSAAALALLAAGGVLVGDRDDLVSSLLGLLGLVATAWAAFWFVRHPRPLRRAADAALDRLARHWRTAAGLRRGVDTVLDELAEVHLPRRVWLIGFGLALANWAADVVCLLAACLAAGVHPDLVTTVLAYTAGMAAASTVPLLPGGLGAVEAALILALRHGGAALAAATSAVIGYRVISFGLVAAVGWGVLLVQRRRRRSRGPRESLGDASKSGLVHRRVDEPCFECAGR
jgi:putative heme transporter